MLQQREYDWLRALLLNGRICHPRVVTRELSNHVQKPNNCHLISMQAAVQYGERPVLGVQFLELYGKLYPWAHMVNEASDGLVDYSTTRPIRPNFGFIATTWDSFDSWRGVLAQYQSFDASIETAMRWQDDLADRLTEEFLPSLQAVGSTVPSPGFPATGGCSVRRSG